MTVTMLPPVVGTIFKAIFYHIIENFFIGFGLIFVLSTFVFCSKLIVTIKVGRSITDVNNAGFGGN